MFNFKKTFSTITLFVTLSFLSSAEIVSNNKNPPPTNYNSSTSKQIPSQLPTYQPPSYEVPVYQPFVAENGSYRSQVSAKTHKSKNTYVRGYYRKDGTYVRGHYRSKKK